MVYRELLKNESTFVDILLLTKTIAIEKTVSHLKVSKEIGEQKLKEFSDKFDDLSKRMEAKKEVYDKLFKKD